MSDQPDANVEKVEQEPDAPDPWSAIIDTIEGAKADADEALSTLASTVEDHMGALIRKEARRAVAWVETGWPPAEVIAGIMSYEDAPKPTDKPPAPPQPKKKVRP